MSVIESDVIGTPGPNEKDQDNRCTYVFLHKGNNLFIPLSTVPFTVD